MVENVVAQVVVGANGETCAVVEMMRMVGYYYGHEGTTTVVGIVVHAQTVAASVVVVVIDVWHARVRDDDVHEWAAHQMGQRVLRDGYWYTVVMHTDCVVVVVVG